ncbi:MAG: hypothetical protein FWE24_09875 [Defluviitaleaceae bacterium]|nr:hypothetical protein [Defluviitaleaceae bacterium]
MRKKIIICMAGFLLILLLASCNADVVGNPVLPSEGGTLRVNEHTEFQFTPNATGFWAFQTSNNAGSVPYLALMDLNYNIIASDSYGGQDNNSHLIVHLTSGTNYIISAGFSHGSFGRYTLSIERIDVSTLTSGESIRVLERGIYKFIPETTGIWVFETTERSINSDPHLTLMDLENNIISFDDDGAGDLNAYLVAHLTAGEQYVILAKNLRGQYSDFILSAEKINPQTINIGDEIRFETRSIYLFTPAVTGIYSFEITSANGEYPDVRLGLIDLINNELIDIDFRTYQFDDSLGAVRHGYNLTANTAYIILAQTYSDDSQDRYILKITQP